MGVFHFESRKKKLKRERGEERGNRIYKNRKEKRKKKRRVNINKRKNSKTKGI